MEIPDFEIATELKQDMAAFEAMWGLYDSFNNGLEELAKEDWISFRYGVSLNIVLLWYNTYISFIEWGPS